MVSGVMIMIKKYVKVGNRKNARHIIEANGLIAIDLHDFRMLSEEKGSKLRVRKYDFDTFTDVTLSFKEGMESIIVHITSSEDIALSQVNDIVEHVQFASPTELNVIYGTSINEKEKAVYIAY